jgi:hypothetical protein
MERVGEKRGEEGRRELGDGSVRDGDPKSGREEMDFLLQRLLCCV